MQTNSRGMINIDNKMENTDYGLIGMCTTLFGYLGTLIGAMWNLEAMQIFAFFFTAFAGFGTGIYYIVRAIKEVINKKKSS